MSVLKDIFLDTTMDGIRMLPFLFGAFLILEALERVSAGKQERLLRRVGWAGPAAGALLGCIPQCGFSVMAANFYSGGIISAGTLLSVFIATSDEALLILLGYPDRTGEILQLILLKIVIAIPVGYLVDIFLRKKITVPKAAGELCRDCRCHEEKSILMPALRHTLKVFLYLYAFTFVLNGAIELLGMERISAILLNDTVFQPVIATVIGLIPNCASSVILTQLYLAGAISFPSVAAGLCSGAGIGVLVLFKVNPHKGENMKILGCLAGAGILAGVFLQALMSIG